MRVGDIPLNGERRYVIFSTHKRLIIQTTKLIIMIIFFFIYLHKVKHSSHDNRDTRILIYYIICGNIIYT